MERELTIGDSEVLHRNLRGARILHALYFNFLVGEQLPLDVPRHDLLLALLEHSFLPAHFELVLRVGITALQLRSPSFLAGLTSLGFHHKTTVPINPMSAA